MPDIVLFHGSNSVVKTPQILENGFYKDFGYGFYCTNIEKQAKRWALTKRKDHDYDIVEGAMADDTIWDYVEDYIGGRISKAAFWELVKFKYPTHQIAFCSDAALQTLRFEGSYNL